MPKITYIRKNFRSPTLARIATANSIIEEYQAQGFSLTLRQLYYQLVARGIIPNAMNEYKKLVKTVSDARLAGLIDWHAIEDRTRTLRGNSHWTDPVDIMNGAVDGYQIDKWENQPNRVEVWIEKDALVGVISGVCSELDIDYFSCRGYPSASSVWRGAMRLARYNRSGQHVNILHFGDHDPSGMDMTRDILDRLELLSGVCIHVNRIALNMDQVNEYNPPPNPAKLTDSRVGYYIQHYGRDSWELDALEPLVIVDLIRQSTLALRDNGLWSEKEEQERHDVSILSNARDDMAEMYE